MAIFDYLFPTGLFCFFSIISSIFFKNPSALIKNLQLQYIVRDTDNPFSETETETGKKAIQ